MSTMTKSEYYAVPIGRVPGIYSTWAEAEVQMRGFLGAKYLKFSTEAAAKSYMAQSTALHPISVQNSQPNPPSPSSARARQKILGGPIASLR